MFVRLKKTLEGLLYDNTVEEEHYRKIRQKSSSGSAITVGLVAAVGGFLYGYDTGLINDLLEMTYVEKNISSNGINFNVHERALLTAVLSLGTFVGALVAPILSDRYGRKFSIVLSSAIIFNIGNILQVSASEVNLMCIGRAVSGLSVGILSAIVPLYQAEASPKWVRGSIVYTYQWAITWGLLIASAICQGTRKLTNSGSYRVPIGLQFVWSLCLCIGMFFLPESPRFYVQKNDIQKALDSLTKLRRLPHDDTDLIEELVEIKANYDYELSFGKTTILDCFRSGGARHKQTLRILTGIGVHAFQQCSGINFIFYYGVNFFASSGMKNFYLMSFVTYLVNTVFTIPGLILVDIIGRRKLLIGGGIGMAFCNFIIAIIGVTVKHNEINSIISISFSCGFIACFASSWGGAVWAIASDIYGISIRQKAIAITAATNWLVNFVFAYITPYLIDTGKHTAALGNRIFFIWGGLNTLGVIFVYFMVYETKGLKLEEVDYMYQNCANSRLSTKFKSGKLVNRVSGSNTPPTQESITAAVNNSNLIEKLQPQSQPVNLIPFHDNLQPSFSSSSGSSASSSSSIRTNSSMNDYQRYLNSLQKETSDSHNHPDTSQTSTSIIRDFNIKNQPQQNLSEYDLEQLNLKYDLVMRDQNHPTDSKANTNANNETNNMTIIATPFFSSPPSDSDSESDES